MCFVPWITFSTVLATIGSLCIKSLYICSQHLVAVTHVAESCQFSVNMKAIRSLFALNCSMHERRITQSCEPPRYPLYVLTLDFIALNKIQINYEIKVSFVCKD